MLEQNATGGLIVLWDPVAIAELYGSSDDQATVAVGGRAPGSLGPPVVVSGRVRRAGQLRYRRTSSYATGQKVDAGRVAVLETSVADVVLTENRIVPFDDDHVRALGIEPRQKQIIVAKGAVAWKAGFGVYAAQSIYCRTPGCCPGDLSQLEYGPSAKHLYPLDSDAAWPRPEARSLETGARSR
jgi:microcystin degradation protein MlrC